MTYLLIRSVKFYILRFASLDKPYGAKTNDLIGSLSTAVLKSVLKAKLKNEIAIFLEWIIYLKLSELLLLLRKFQEPD